MERSPESEADRRQKISARMKVVRTEIPNPMSDPEVRSRVSKTLQAMGHKPPVRGGNGTGPTECEQLLYDSLTRISEPQLWSLGHVVPTGAGRPGGLPGHYKIDIASPELMIAIEVDGFSHSALVRKEQDRRKDSFLSSRGWAVFRFSNQAVREKAMELAQSVMSTRSR